MLEDCFLFFSDNIKETDVSLQILLSIVPAIFGIIGVVLGGCITYSIQKKERILHLLFYSTHSFRMFKPLIKRRFYLM